MMKHIVIVTLGSQGDVQPFVALGCGLKAAGHMVKLATGKNYEMFVRELGLDFVPIGGDIKAMLSSDEGRRFMKSSNPISAIRRMKKAAGELLATMQEDILKSLKGAHLVVFSYLCGPLIDIVEKTDLPCFMGILQPLLRTGEFPHFAVTLKNLGPMLNRLTYDVFQFIMWVAFGKMANRWRSERFGLPPVRIFRRIEKLRIPVLGAFSSHIIPKPADWPDHADITGYWFLDKNTSWQPPTGLENFIHSGRKPICIGFGSMLDDQTEQRMSIVKECIAHTHQRAIVVGGWSTPNAKEINDENLYWIDNVPHDWLLPQVTAMVHHGGAGTTAAALRADVPSVIVPFFADQPFWADRVYRLGLSPRPIPRRSLTSERLMHAIRTVAEDASIRQRTADIGKLIRIEDGVSSAIKIIERRL